MEPITREEYYLAKIAGTYKGKTPEPVTIDEYYLATMAGDYSGNTPQPVTRLQYYMAKVAGVWGGSIPAPVTRLEYYWAAIASGEGKVFPPVTREEHFLVLVADAYSVVLTVVTGNPALLENSKGNRGLESLTLYGKSTQGSTTGVQLLPFEVGEKREGFEVFKDGIAISGARKKDIYAVGRDGMTNESSYDDFPLLASGEYYVYSDSASVNLIVVAFRNGINITLGSSMKGVAAKIKVMDGDKFRIFLRLEEAFNGKVKAMISKTQPTASNYEPYTGGKPSPSPEYPQAIESVGDAGEINVEVCGKNLIGGRKFYGNYSNGIAYIIKLNDDVVFPYKPLYASYGICYAINALAGKKYTFSGYNLNDNATLKIAEYANLNDALDIANVIGYKSGGYHDTFVTYTAKKNGVIICLISGRWSADNDSIHICTESELLQTELGSTATSYEPYKPAQTLIIPTPNGLPGIPVSSGGNYTDEKGQQWVCDTIEFRNGVAERVQRISKTIIDGDNVKFSESSSHSEFVNLTWYSAPGVASVRNTYMNAYFPSDFFSSNTNYDFIFTTSTRIMQYFETIKELNAFFAEKYVEGNPLTIFYTLRSPTRIPLTAEELAKLKALRTYSPTTTVINDAGAGMSVGYAKMK